MWNYFDSVSPPNKNLKQTPEDRLEYQKQYNKSKRQRNFQTSWRDDFKWLHFVFDAKEIHYDCEICWHSVLKSRIPAGSQKKKEFFERQKLAASQSLLIRTPAKKKQRLSQDLVALHTVSRVHSQFPAGFESESNQTWPEVACNLVKADERSPDLAASRSKPVKKVDLDKFRSCTQQVDDVDMGPCSPSQTPSKLLLNDGKVEKKSSYMFTTTNTDDHKPSRELFPQPEIILKPRTNKHHSFNSLGEHEWKITLETPAKRREKKHGEKQSDVYIPPILPNAFSFSRPKLTSDDICNVTKTKIKYDPFVSEDFQVTPLVRYSKKRAKSDVEMVKTKKHCDRLKHGQIEKKHTNTFEIDKVHSFKQSQFTSTPLKELPEYIDLKEPERLDCFASISPIFKEAAFSKDADDGFRFKPRLDVSKREISAFDIWDKSIVGTGNVNSHTQSYMYKSHGENASFALSNKETNVNEYDSGNLNRSLSIPNESPNNFTLRSKLLSYSRDFEYDASITKGYPDESVYDSSLSVGKISSESDKAASGSLSKYRHIIGQKSERQSPVFQFDTVSGNEMSLKHVEKEHKLDFDSNVATTIPKPKFAEVEFQYKPLKTGKMNIEAASGIMNMYKELGNKNQCEVGGTVDKRGDRLCDDSRRLAGGSVEDVLSPVPADEFPKHLLSPNKQHQDMIDRQLTKIVADERNGILGSMIHSEIDLHRQGTECYRPLKGQMDDVLDEMKQLEEQDTEIPDVPNDQVEMFMAHVPPGVVTTESFEADAYLQTEDLLSNADIENMQYMEQRLNSETTTDSQKHYNEIDKLTQMQATKKQADTANHVCDTELLGLENYCYTQAARIGETNENINVEIDKILESGEVLENHQDQTNQKDNSVIKNRVLHEETGNSILQYDCTAMETADDVNGETIAESGKINSAVSDDCSVFRSRGMLCQQTNENLLQSKVNGDKSSSIVTKRPEETCSDKNEINEQLRASTDKMEANNAAVLMVKQLQDPEISSGKTQYTQTYTNFCSTKSFVENSTSPCQEFIMVQEVVDVGIQCNLNLFPTLSSLAGKTFNVKPVRNSVTTKACVAVKQDSVDVVNHATTATDRSKVGKLSAVEIEEQDHNEKVNQTNICYETTSFSS